MVKLKQCCITSFAEGNHKNPNSEDMKNKKVGHPRRNQEVALDCSYRRNRGQTEEQIGDHYHWKKQIDDYGKTRCVTARRYVRYGEELREQKRKLAEEAFGIKYEAPVRVRHRKKPIDK